MEIEKMYTAGEIIFEDQVTEIQFEILKTLQEHGTIVIRDIIRIIKRPESTIRENLAKLVQKGYVLDRIKLNQKKGRPTHYYTLDRTTRPN